MLVCRCGFGSSGDVSSVFPLARGGGLKNARAADGKDFPSPIASDVADPAAYWPRSIRARARTREFGFSYLRLSRCVDTMPTSGTAQRFMVIPAPTLKAARTAAANSQLAQNDRRTHMDCGRPQGPTPAGTTGYDATLKASLSETR